MEGPLCPDGHLLRNVVDEPGGNGGGHFVAMTPAEICVAGVSETSRACRAMLVSPGMESRGCSGGA